ncbi:MAG: 4-hydroxy-tetrahydrodipicolinate reductase [Saprospiraceae bacterium]
MKVTIIGYGKMGKSLERLLKNTEHEIVAISDGKHSNELVSKLAKADVAIDFTTPETAYGNIMTCVMKKVPIVSGTTGWLDKYDEVVKAVIKEDASFFYASNFSIGVNIFYQLNKYLAQLMNNFPNYDVMLEEIHHTIKKDFPSGTALTIAEDILSKIDRKNGWESNTIGEMDKLSVYSKRIGKVFGAHEVQYHNSIDVIKLSHEAFGREGFAIGAISAAEWLIGKKGVYGMNEMLSISGN